MREKSILPNINKAIQRFMEKYSISPNSCFLTKKTLENLVLDSLFDLNTPANINTLYGLKLLEGNINCVSLIEEI